MTEQPNADAGGVWPSLPYEEWRETCATLHMWTQVVGKVRLALEPAVNHTWQAPLYVSARGLTTSLMPYGDRGVEMEFDFQRHVLDIRTTDGGEGQVRLEPRSVADFHAETMAQLERLGMPVVILPRPVEVQVAIPFAEDDTHSSYDPEYTHDFWLSLVHAKRVFTEFRSGFIGKASNIHFFWGSFDLAVTRFSGRAAPLYPGAAPNCAPWVMQEAYSHEVSSCGYWPAGADEGTFYSYAYPEPEGFRDWPVEPAGAYYDPQLGEFLLPYELVRKAADPDVLVLAFLQSTYEAAAELAGWNRTELEAPGPGPTPSLDLQVPNPAVIVSDVPEKQRFEATLDGALAARAEYVLADDLIIFPHTEVNPGFDGRGVAATLVRQSLDEARRRGLTVIPLCPFYQGWIQRHPQYQDVLYEPSLSRVRN